MTEIFNMIFIEGDFIKTFCSIFIFSLCCELIFGIVSTIGSFVTSSKG